jgi:ribonuclease P protein subunit RPR2
MSFMGRPAARRNYGKTREAVASVARERIEILIDQAKEMVRKNEKLSRRYVDLAGRISERTKVRIPSELKRYLCKGCGIPLVPGQNARVRLYARNTGIVITCLSCGALRRYPISGGVRSKKALRPMKPYIAQTLPFPKKNSNKD